MIIKKIKNITYVLVELPFKTSKAQQMPSLHRFLSFTLYFFSQSEHIVLSYERHRPVALGLYLFNFGTFYSIVLNPAPLLSSIQERPGLLGNQGSSEVMIWRICRTKCPHCSLHSWEIFAQDTNPLSSHFQAAAELHDKILSLRCYRGELDLPSF